jgi:hypothetical protein
MRLVESELLQAQRQIEDAVKDGQWSTDDLPSLPPSWEQRREVLADALPPELFLDVDTACVEVGRERSAAVRALDGQLLSSPLDQVDKTRLQTIAAQVGEARRQLNQFRPN